MIGNINLETLERLLNLVKEKGDLNGKVIIIPLKWKDSRPYRIGYKVGYKDAMKHIAGVIEQILADEIEYQTEELNAMYNDEFGEDGR